MSKLDLEKFVAVMWGVKELFDCKEHILLCKPNKKEGIRILEEIEKGGNFGHYNNDNLNSNETLLKRYIRRMRRQIRMISYDFWYTLVLPLTRLQLKLWINSVNKEI